MIQMNEFLPQFRSKKKIAVRNRMRLVRKAGMIPSILYKSHSMIDSKRIVFQVVRDGCRCSITIEINDRMGREERIPYKEDLHRTKQSTEHNGCYFFLVFKLSLCCLLSPLSPLLPSQKYTDMK